MASTPWTVSVVPPRPARAERSLYLRARRTVDGRAEEQRCSARTLDPDEAERKRLRFEVDLNAGGRTTLPAVMDARIAVLEAEAARGEKSLESVGGFQRARAKLADVLGDAEVDRPALLRARDLLLRQELGSETINTYMRRAAACWRWAEQRGLVATPWPKLPPLRKPPRKKRPFTPAEVEAVLAWAREYQGGAWAGILTLIAETGRRVGEACRLRGRDLDRRELTVRVLQKGGRVLTLPVTAETMALLPDVGPDEWVFRRRRQRRTGCGWGPLRRDVVLGLVRRAILALGIPDGERLDTHSLRRSFAAIGTRAGVPNDVLRRLSGHETEAMLGHYQRDTVGDDTRAALEQVRDYRRAAAATSPGTSPASPSAAADESPENEASPDAVRACEWGYQESNLRPRPYQHPDRAPEGHGAAGSVEGAPGEVRTRSGEIARLSDMLLARRDPDLAIAARWASESPEVFRAVVDTALGRELLDALRAAGLLPDAPAGDVRVPG